MPTPSRRRPPARFDASFSRAALFVIVIGVALAAAVAACSAAPADSGPGVSVDPNAPELIAHGLLFDKSELDIPSGQAFQLILDNDDGVAHNIAIYSDENHTQVVFRGDLVSTGIHVYQVPAIAPGTYYFQCDVHPQMHGIVVAGQG